MGVGSQNSKFKSQKVKSKIKAIGSWEMALLFLK